MKLDKTLNFKKVRCVKAYDDCLKIGKEYDVIDISVEIKVKDDEGEFLYWESDHFEPVLDSAENPLQGVELTPEFEAVEPVLADNCQVNIQDIGTDILDTNADIKDTPKFKVGDPVYFPRLSNKLCVIGEGQEDDYVDEVNGSKALAEMQSDLDFVYDQKTKSWLWDEKDCAPQLLYATPENHALLSKLYPHIKFEAPPKPLTGSELCRAIKAKGKKFIICAVSDISEEDAINNYLNGDEEMDVIFEIDDELDHPFIAIWGNLYKFAVPLSEETGEPLTESILND